ncbi:DUF2333 family protein, partial [Pseudoalteromonas sp. S1612]|uniref:DUF2333 family protein n=1 Tax=Pseudoalteromonas sp. S1612 TaxID=579507 RepID=UPI00110A66FB
ASLGKVKVYSDLAGISSNTHGTYTQLQQDVRTSWGEIYDVFYESGGATWALLHFLQAVEYDFADVLDKKNDRVSIQQIIR